MKQAFTSNVYFFPDEVVYHTITNASLASHSLWSTRKKVKVTQRSQVNRIKKLYHPIHFSNRYLKIQNFYFQPQEFVKISMPFYFYKYQSGKKVRRQKDYDNPLNRMEKTAHRPTSIHRSSINQTHELSIFSKCFSNGQFINMHTILLISFHMNFEIFKESNNELHFWVHINSTCRSNGVNTVNWKAHNVVLSDINRLLFSCVKVISKFPGIHCRRNKKHLETRHQFLVNQNHNLLVCKVVISLDINIKMKIMLPVMWNFILLILIKLIKIIRLVVLNEADFISSLN